MIKPIYDLTKDITEKEALDLLGEAMIDCPPLTNAVKWRISIRWVNMPEIYVLAYDDETQWEIKVRTREVMHRGYGRGCFWEKWR